MKAYALVALGSAIGGMARFWIGTHLAHPAFPWATFLINTAGSFAIGFASNWAHVQGVRFLIMVGLCGGFTTFSSFSLETLALIRQGAALRAGAYIGGSVLACLASVWLGFSAARWQQQ